MLSNRNKQLLSDKFNFLKEKFMNKQPLPVLKEEREETTSEEEELSNDEEKTSEEEEPNKTANNPYTYYADSLNKAGLKTSYDKIHICLYKINTQELYPFLMFLLYKDEMNTLSLPEIKYTGQSQDLVKYVLTEFREIFSDLNVEIDYKGFINNGKEEVVIVLEYTEKQTQIVSKNKTIIEKGAYANRWWWVLPAEIINERQVLTFPIQDLVTNFFLKNNKLALLYRKNNEVYETPEIGYYGNYYKKIAAVASLGLSRESPYASFGPFYYFSNYTHAMRNAFWARQAKPVKIGEEYITVDDKGRYKKGGLVRFALFTGKTKMLLGRPSDKEDDSEISQELASKSDFVKAMLKLRDTAANWLMDYNSIRIGTHHIQVKENDKDKLINTNPLVALREYEQQVPLEYYFVDTSQLIEEENIAKAVIL